MYITFQYILHKQLSMIKNFREYKYQMDKKKLSELMLVIKNFIIDNAKIRLQIEENKKRPKKTGGFSARLQKAMEQAEKQRKLQKRSR